MFLARLAAVQVRSAGRIAIVGFLIAAASMPFVMRLGLNSDWTALLPKNTPSVRDLETVRARFGGMATLTVALHSKDQAAMEKLGTHLAKEIERIGPPVRHVGWTISPYQDFVAERRHMYLSLDSLRRIRDDLQSRIDYEKLSANPFYLDLEDDKPPTLEEIVDTVKKETEGKSSEFEKYPNGFYIHPDGDLLAIFVRTYLENDDVDGSVRLMDRVQGLIDAANPTTYASDMRVDLGGDIPEALEEQRAITQELVIATSITLALVLLVVFFYFGRGRSIPLLGLALVPPVAMTFAVAEVTVDYLNTSTAFLGSIVVGNGVNPNIMWLARYFEERRSGKSPEGAVTAAHLATWAATLTASLAAAIAYASLTVTDFRGFRDFGIIGGVGMVLCWVGSIAFLPALVLVSERWKPMIFSKVATGRDWFAWSFAKLVNTFPRGIVLVSAATGVAATGIVIFAIVNDPLEYDLGNLRSIREATAQVGALNDRINEYIPKTATGTVVAALAPDRAQAKRLERALEARRDRGEAVYGPVNTAFDLLPQDQPKKVGILKEIRELLLEMRAHASDEDQARIDEYIPPEKPLLADADDLPAAIATPFTERDGTVGTIVVTEQSAPGLNWDGRYMVQWTKDVRAVTLADGTHPPTAGRPPVFADIFDVIWRDGPIAILMSFLATIILVIVAFRRPLSSVLLLGTLLLGIVWMGGTMAVFGMKLNFLNFVAYPITFGNGVDYGVNVMRRFTFERTHGLSRHDAIQAAVKGAGGAVVLCSLTTIIGYMSLYASANLAINSFGAAMAISEVTCVLAAVMTLPAVLMLIARRRDSRAA